MTFGVSLTSIHVVISLVAIVAGLGWLTGLVKGRQRPPGTSVFLLTTLATSLTGFLFPIGAITPAFVFGVVSIVTLAIAFAALYWFRLSGAWRATYVVTAIFALYLNIFVAVVQSFQKIGALQRLAPTQSEPPFAIAQALLLVVIVGMGWLALKRVPAGTGSAGP